MKMHLIAAVAIVVAAPALGQTRGASEAAEINALIARESGRPAYSPANATRFRPQDNVFVASALEIDFTPRKATVTLPLFRGAAPGGATVYYILTEASDFAFARAMGINYAPKLKNAAGSPGAARATLDDGVLSFPGNIDFSPKHMVVPGSPMPFPPKVAKPGAMADANYTSILELPSGIVVNAQIVHNDSGSHDRANRVDVRGRTATMQLLDGYQGGKRLFYHLVTDVSVELPAALENGVLAPRLGRLPAIGQSRPAQRSALLGFSPVVNGPTQLGREQGFAASLANGGIDPINVFPVGPANANRSATNNYSPLWDAHISFWTAAATGAGKVRRITSIQDLAGLVKAGMVTNAPDNPPGPGNPYIAGLRPSRAIVNCPVIAHPVERR